MIGIMSDSHDNREAIRAAVRIFNTMNCTMVIHAGDFVAPFAAAELAHLTCPVNAVYGNCDGERAGLAQEFAAFGTIRSEPFAFAWLGHNFLVTHTQFANKTYLAEKKPDILIYGHTHKVDISRKKHTLIINPGETGGWVTGTSTIAVLDPDTLIAEILTL